MELRQYNKVLGIESFYIKEYIKNIKSTEINFF